MFFLSWLYAVTPEDLAISSWFQQRCETQPTRLEQASKKIAIVVGHPWWQNGKIYNALSFFYKGELQARYFKQQLLIMVCLMRSVISTRKWALWFRLKLSPNLNLWRYLDQWTDWCIKTSGADLVLSINASPYNRENRMFIQLIKEHYQGHLPVIYLNQIGGQDELVFDGCSKSIWWTGCYYIV